MIENNLEPYLQIPYSSTSYLECHSLPDNNQDKKTFISDKILTENNLVDNMQYEKIFVSNKMLILNQDIPCLTSESENENEEDVLYNTTE